MPIPHHLLLAAAVTALLCRPSLAAEKRENSENPTNVVLIMCDDLGWGDLQCFHPESPIHTPQIDAMAAAGLKWTRFYSAAPVCSPTRGSCLTGRHPFRYGIYFANTGHLRAEEITLPELLHEQGYATGHFGKWHLGTLTTEIPDSNRGGPRNTQHFAPPREHGYVVCLVTEAKVPTYDPLLKPRNAPRTAWDFLRDPAAAVPYGTHYWNEKGETITENMRGDDSRIIMDRALEFIDASTNQQRPFFAAIWFHAPHLPVVAGPEHVKRYADRDVYERNYYGCISALDEQVGRLRSQLRELGRSENTMIWFCSDNGPEGKAGKAPGLAGPFRGRKRSLYEGGVRVPGILEWPARVAAGGVTDFPAVTSDYLPTILDALGLEYPDDTRPLDGISLMPVIDGTLRERDQPIGFQSGKQQSLVTQQFKLYTPNAGKTWELYNLLADPAETTDLSTRAPETRARLQQRLADWLASCKASDAGEDYDAGQGR